MKHRITFVLICLMQIPMFAQMVAKKSVVEQKDSLNYLLYTPKDTIQNMPLVVFLHGGGESGTEIELVKKHGLPKLIEEGKEFPFYVFAPQNRYKKGLWNDRLIHAKTMKLADSLKIDKNRIYLVGMSRGGDGVWRMAVNHPNSYAALISICAASIPYIYLQNIPDLPVWFFHGEKDMVVPVEQTIEAYTRMRQLNENVELTLYPEVNHDCWTITFQNEEIYDWLLSFSLKENK